MNSRIFKVVGLSKFRENGKEIIPETIISIQKEQIDGLFVISDSLKDINLSLNLTNCAKRFWWFYYTKSSCF